MINVLVMGAGSGPAVSIIKLLRNQTEIPVRIFGSDADPSAAGLYLCDHHFITPAASEEIMFVEFLKLACSRREIKAIFCPLDVENLVLSRYKKDLEWLGMKLLCDEWQKIVIATDKILSVCMCDSCNIPVPKTYYNTIPSEFEGRYMIKPSIGCGGVKNKIIDKNVSVDSIQDVVSEPFLCQQYIYGTEYSIDILCDKGGQPLYVVPRERISVKAGQTVKGRTTKDQKLRQYAKSVAKSFAISGVCCLQCIKNDEGIFFIEYNPRYGTGVNLTGAAGINMPLLHLKLELGMSIRTDLDYKEITMSRYWQEVFM